MVMNIVSCAVVDIGVVVGSASVSLKEAIFDEVYSLLFISTENAGGAASVG